MDFKNIYSEVRKLSVITEVWCKRGVAEEIERALVLDKLKHLYEQVMFMEQEEDEEYAEPEVEVEFVYPDEEAEESESDAEPEAEAEEPAPQEDDEAAEPEPEPVVVDEARPEPEPVVEEVLPEPESEPEVEEVQPEPESEPVIVEETLPEPEPMPEPVAEEPAEAVIEPVEEKPEPVVEVKTVTEVVRMEKPRPQQSQPRFNEQSLFDLDEIQPVRRTSRDVLLSLYSDDEEEAPAAPAAPELEIELGGPEEDNVVKVSEYENDSQLQDVVEEPRGEDDEPSVEEDSADVEIAEPESVEEEDEEPFVDLDVEHDAAEDFDSEEFDDDDSGFYSEDDDEDFNVIEIPDEEDDEEEEHPAVFGDVMMESSAPALGDTFRPARTVENGPVRSLKGSIGLNDKFMIIRTLFGGDAELYERTIEDLEEFTDLDDALLYLHGNFRWKPDNEGVNMLVGLLMRKLS